jgi:hypothetical protein
MQSIWESKGKKLRTRKIEVSTYEYDEQRVIVEGSFKDGRFRKSYIITGEISPSGLIHHMTIRLLVNCSNRMIEDVGVNLTSFPMEECRETIGSLAPIKGLTITKGFTLKVKQMVGGNKGCTHLVELLQAMAPAVVQGVNTHQSQIPSSFNTDRTQRMLKNLINSCYAWKEDGPLVKRLQKNIDTK